MRFEINEISQAMNGQVLSCHLSQFSKVGTDTRKDLQGHIFFALQGDNFNAHDFLHKALEARASALVIHDKSKVTSDLLNKITIIQVENTLTALQKLAHFERIRRNFKILSMTGSNGKTTTKEFTSQILAPYFKTFANQGSFNNHWGVPLTLLDTPVESEISVVEMGMNHYHEIQSLVEIAAPDVVTCTMVGQAHIENFGSIANIAKAKYEIYQYSADSAVRLFNIDQEETRWMFENEKKRLGSRLKHLTYSQLSQDADIYLKLDNISFQGLELSGHIQGSPVKTHTPIFGSQNMTNILAASAFAVSVGVKAQDIEKQLSQLQTTWGRNQILQTSTGVNIIFDGYNANPDSFQALLDNVKLVQSRGKKIAVFGQMRELGDLSSKLHFELGQNTARENFNTVFFMGIDAQSFAEGFKQANGKALLITQNEYSEDLKNKISMIADLNDTIFAKASRGTQIEKLLNKFSVPGFSFNK